jgi:hypothetical protein
MSGFGMNFVILLKMLLVIATTFNRTQKTAMSKFGASEVLQMGVGGAVAKFHS